MLNRNKSRQQKKMDENTFYKIKEFSFIKIRKWTLMFNLAEYEDVD